ncbi:GHMP kinase [Rhizobium sp. TRM96647]|uniref:beta-ribofuranosylaminobenzene 5'-phosphate synthase family protein n=1 Tax=unclassified Rhizobium TaxID=2613769 RepID=UPI0021E95E15|nr:MULTISPECIES: beta-ribofuranosylaminobenzene 5'-phosphate synthase family protein [unclassified Rhizobium]MCV3737793.1 GHMP kinase [Rhizobium sp. TRM96647]MCV3759477.1 GHMP kinase [Rhizobium sp. TRM96650]
MSDSVSIQVPGRLHLGFLDIPGKASSRFGSIGLPLEGISTRLEITRAAETSVHGNESARISAYLSALRSRLGLAGHHRVTVLETIPTHAGLGSGTQLALAVSAALRTLHDLPFDVRADAAFLGRGGRSGIGIAAFDEGGLIFDAGKARDDLTPTVISRIPFPSAWRAILVFDGRSQGVHGDAEITAFRTLAPFPAAHSAAICRHVLMEIMPAVIERDILTFGNAVTAVQQMLGDYFSPTQGGRFTSPAVEETLMRLGECGAVGIGQSSWGPTGFAFAESQAAAERIVARAAPHDTQTTIRIVAGRNRGAKITREATPHAFELGRGTY